MAGPLVEQAGVEWTPPSAEPALPVTFIWPGPGGRTGTCHMRWQKGLTVKQYLHQQPLRDYPLLGMWKRSKAYNRNKKKVKLSYVPCPGDAIVLFRSARPLS